MGADFERIQAHKKNKEQGMSHAMKAILGAEDALKSMCFLCWIQDCRQERLLLLKMSKERQAAARQRALAMIERNLFASLQTLLLSSLEGWCEVIKLDQLHRRKKEAIIMMVMRGNSRSEDVCRSLCLECWAKIALRR